MKTLVLLLLVISIIQMGNAQQTNPTASELQRKAQRFAPTELTADLSKLSNNDRQALQKLIEASRLMDSLYLRQEWSGNIALLTRLKNDNSELGKAQLHYYNINMGPWSKLDHDEPFIAGVPKKPLGANHYPEDMTKEEFESWVNTLSKDDQEKARGFFYSIRRDEKGGLKLVSFADEYRAFLEPAAMLLKEAADLTENASLKHYLSSRADAFLSNDYYASDVAWMELDAPIEPTIGPYEVYMDELFNYKASFEAYITVRNDEETRKLAMFSDHLQDIENHLPIDPKYRNPKIGALSPIRVVDEVYIGGEARSGVQTAAFNLPNDERVTKEKGSKRVMLRNVQEAKFQKTLIPISQKAVDKELRGDIAFEPFFTQILMHELMHGLGPHSITVDGKATTVRQAMKELSSALEEAKADISGLWALQYLIDKGIIEKSMEKQMYATFLAGMFRSVRFGLNEAHGKGVALQFNYLTDEGAIKFDPATKSFSVDYTKIKPAVTKLTTEIMTIQAEGSYEKAKTLLDKYVVIRPDMKAVLDGLTDIPTDIEPHFPLAQP